MTSIWDFDHAEARLDNGHVYLRIVTKTEAAFESTIHAHEKVCAGSCFAQHRHENIHECRPDGRQHHGWRAILREEPHAHLYCMNCHAEWVMLDTGDTHERPGGGR